MPEVKFPSVQHLVSYYGENEVKNLQKVNNVRFLYPLKSRRESRTESFEDSGSSTSGNSHYQSTTDVAMSLENPPALPTRPRDLPDCLPRTLLVYRQAQAPPASEVQGRCSKMAASTAVRCPLKAGGVGAETSG